MIEQLDLQAMIDNAVLAGGGRIVLPKGSWEISPVVIPEIIGTIELVGAGEGSFGLFSETMLFCKASQQEDAITVYGYGHTLRGFRLTRFNSLNSPYRGILIRASYCKVDRVTVDNVLGDGFYQDGQGFMCFGNQLEGCRASKCGKSGYITQGASAGVGGISYCDSRNNGEYGFRESGFLMTTYVGCHATSNVGSYCVDGVANYSVFLGCYMEMNQPAPVVNSSTALAVGGNLERLWPTNAMSVGYYSRLRFAAGKNNLTIPTDFAPLRIAHEDSTSWWRAFERYTGSMPWLQNTRVLLRHKSEAYGAFAVTDERHPLGPGLAQYGHAASPSAFRAPVRKLLEVTESGLYTVEISSPALDPAKPGEPIVTLTLRASSSEDAGGSINKVVLIPHKAVVTVLIEGAGSYFIEGTIERWVL